MPKNWRLIPKRTNDNGGFQGIATDLAIVCGKRRRPGANLDKTTADGQLGKWIIQNEVENSREGNCQK